MQFIFSTPVLIRHLWQLETLVFLHWCIILAVLLIKQRHRFVIAGLAFCQPVFSNFQPIQYLRARVRAYLQRGDIWVIPSSRLQLKQAIVFVLILKTFGFILLSLLYSLSLSLSLYLSHTLSLFLSLSAVSYTVSLLSTFFYFNLKWSRLLAYWNSLSEQPLNDLWLYWLQLWQRIQNMVLELIS